MRKWDALLIVAFFTFLLMSLLLTPKEPVSLENAQKGSLVEFSGVCVYSSGDFSVLSNGSRSVPVYASLEIGKVYKVVGVFDGRGIKPREVGDGLISLQTFVGAYWFDNGPQLLMPERIWLLTELNISKGTIIEVKGLFHGRKLVPVSYTVLGRSEQPRDGMPFKLRGTVIYGGNPATLWWWGEAVRIYLPKGIELEPGTLVEVLGVIRVRSTLVLYVNDPADVRKLGSALEVPLGEAEVGDVVRSSCRVVGRSGRGLKLECLDKPLAGFEARTGDLIVFRALKRPGSYLCLECSVIEERESLENSICFPGSGVRRISGTVSWVKVYSNGFGLANVTERGCWVLLKLRKSLNITLSPGERVDAYGFFTEYRGFSAFEVQGREDICWGSS
ncbi:hypothetical protein [Pyrococcus yayanosii]|uniref:OB-fold nucleic acid binding domain protein n=1 Tax=Pyrococcus yayanosii (strain CH1 / JCM 16557) TaxID=529709 RepID=F8AH77_PYRYC|nr:hypothetical protein [Pyrococcus yayanosii]AEH25307.1 OB-fold nucleic acid binding domain protein [Pyrococcus yayanosii CH1]